MPGAYHGVTVLCGGSLLMAWDSTVSDLPLIVRRDLRQYMLARHEINAANYYFRRSAYLAAIN
jgi:hypothetical protein